MFNLHQFKTQRYSICSDGNQNGKTSCQLDVSALEPTLCYIKVVKGEKILSKKDSFLFVQQLLLNTFRDDLNCYLYFQKISCIHFGAGHFSLGVPKFLIGWKNTLPDDQRSCKQVNRSARSTASIVGQSWSRESSCQRHSLGANISVCLCLFFQIKLVNLELCLNPVWSSDCSRFFILPDLGIELY